VQAPTPLLAQDIVCSSLISSGRQNVHQSGAIRILCDVQAQSPIDIGLRRDNQRGALAKKGITKGHLRKGHSLCFALSRSKKGTLTLFFLIKKNEDQLKKQSECPFVVSCCVPERCGHSASLFFNPYTEQVAVKTVANLVAQS